MFSQVSARLDYALRSSYCSSLSLDWDTHGGFVAVGYLGGNSSPAKLPSSSLHFLYGTGGFEYSNLLVASSSVEGFHLLGMKFAGSPIPRLRRLCFGPEQAVVYNQGKLIMDFCDFSGSEANFLVDTSQGAIIRNTALSNKNCESRLHAHTPSPESCIGAKGKHRKTPVTYPVLFTPCAILM